MVRRTAALALLLTLLAGCATVRAPEREPPQVTLADLRGAHIGLFEQRYVLELRVRNPNPEPLAINGLDYDLVLNGAPFGSGVSRAAIAIEPYGESPASIEIVSTTGQTLQQLRRLAGEGGGVLRYELRGHAYVEDLGREIPFAAVGSMGAFDADASGAAPVSPGR